MGAIPVTKDINENIQVLRQVEDAVLLNLFQDTGEYLESKIPRRNAPSKIRSLRKEFHGCPLWRIFHNPGDSRVRFIQRKYYRFTRNISKGTNSITKHLPTMLPRKLYIQARTTTFVRLSKYSRSPSRNFRCAPGTCITRNKIPYS